GMAQLVQALDDLLANTPTAADLGRPRLWMDRVFAAKGSGTVITGTLTGGSVSVDDELSALPVDLTVRVRAMQSHHREVELAIPGSRLAINLGGVDYDQLTRGDVLVQPQQWHTTSTIDAEVQILDRLDHEVSRRGAHVMYLGSGEHPVRMRILGPGPLFPGETGPVRLYLDRELPLVVGDRFVLRESGRGETIGGGRVLDVAPVSRASRATPDGSVERFIAERGWVDVEFLEQATGHKRDPDLGHWVVHPPALEAATAELQSAIEAAGPLGLDLAGLDDRKRALLGTLDGVDVDASRVKPADAVDLLADHPFLAELASTPFTPPAPAGVDRGEPRELVRRGLVVEQDGIFFAVSALDLAARQVASMLATNPDGVTVAEVREALGTTRKYALPILARLDSTGVTRRRGDVRIGGPRLPGVRSRET
ncbi:MAG: SelB C-terminal domain-containing protein, partial [Acidimicrobiales bacterium]